MMSHLDDAAASSLQPLHTQLATSVPKEATGSKLSNQPRSALTSRSIESPKTQPEGISDKATAAFVRRVLCSHNVLLGNGERGRSTPQPIEEVLPPLTSSNEVDLQLYAIISVIIKEFVHTWYSKITPDHVFVNEVLQTFAHCTRGLEQRLRKVDLEALILDEIPELLEAHLRSYRLARQHANISHALKSDIRHIYHTLHPHPALSPVPTESVPLTIMEQRESESAWRQLLVQGLLAVLLPTDDLENGCLRALVAEIFAEMILGNGISGKVCEGWLLWEGITSIAKSLQGQIPQEKEFQPPGFEPGQAGSRLERFGLLSKAKVEQVEPKQQPAHSERHHKVVYGSILAMFWTCVKCALLAWTAARAVMMNIATSSSLPLRSITAEQSPAEEFHQSHGEPHLPSRPLGIKRPIVSMRLWSCLAQLLELDMRMPGLSGFISILHWGLLAGPGKVGGTDGILDRFLSHTIRKRILDPAFLPICLRAIRGTLFPNNSLGPPRQSPSPEESKEIKRRCAVSLLNLFPAKVATTLFADQTPSVQLDDIEDLLSCLDDAYLNKHLVYQIIELIVLRLVPELGEQGVRAIIEERLG